MANPLTWPEVAALAIVAAAFVLGWWLFLRFMAKTMPVESRPPRMTAVSKPPMWTSTTRVYPDDSHEPDSPVSVREAERAAHE